MKTKMKATIKKLTACVMAAAMGIIGSGVPAYADPLIPETGNLYIHAYSITDMSHAGVANDGNESDVPSDAKAVSDITYKIYKADTSDNYPESGECNVDSLTEPTKVTDTENNTCPVTFVKSVSTNTSGMALAESLDKGIYLVIEQKNSKVARPSAPFLVSVPMTNATGNGWISDVHVYPKSNDMSISKSVDRTSVHIGEVVTWTLSPTTGSAVSGSSKYDVTDELDDALNFVDNSVVVYGVKEDASKEEVAKSNYSVTVSESNLLTVSFNGDGRNVIKNYASLQIDYQTKINSNILNKEAYTVYNKAKVTLINMYNQETERESNVVNIHSAAINVFKTTPTGQALPGAVFSIASSRENAENGRYLKIDASGNLIDYGEEGYEDAAVWSITTGEDGYAKFEGIRDYNINSEYLTYYLVETNAPEGYSLLGAPVSAVFSAENSTEATSYTVNVNIKNDLIPELPATGGNGIWKYGFAALAIAAIGVCALLIAYKKKENK